MSHRSSVEGIIILLNGPSSVGKTTIQKALQKQSKLPFLRVGIDTFFDALIEEPDLSNFEKEKKFDQLEVIESREKSRNTSPCGHARSHYDTVHLGMRYDLEIDTSKNSADECAGKILNIVNQRD